MRHLFFRLSLTAVIAVAAPSCSRKKPPAPAPAAARPGLIVQAERAAVSKVRTPDDVRPYDESLTWQEYKVRSVSSGELDVPVIRVAHWAVLKGKAVPVSAKIGEVVTLQLKLFDSVPGLKTVNASNDLDIVADEPPRFLDLAQPPPDFTKPANPRFDYGGALSEQMQLYWRLRGQLRLVAMGNSHATKGIATPLFFERENRVTPVALNLAPPGASIEMQCLFIREYVLPLPHIEWVVWVASPRLFNQQMADTRKFQQFTASPGRIYDVAHRSELWPVPAGPPIAVKDLSDLDFGIEFWGWDGRRKTLLPEDPAAARQQILKDLGNAEFAFSDERWKLFQDTVRALNDKGVRVLLVTLPMHPAFRDIPAASDPDGTSHEGNAEVLRHLEAMHAQFPRTWFRDFNHDAHHEFGPADFYDADHVNRDASRVITRKIIAWMDECAKEP